MLPFVVPRTTQPPANERTLRNATQTFAFSGNQIFRQTQRVGTAQQPENINAVALRASRYGLAGAFNGTSNYWRTHSTVPSSPTAFTMLAIVVPAVADSAERTVLSQSNTADENVLCRICSTTGNVWMFQVRANDGSLASTGSTTAVAAGVPAILGAVYRTGSGERSIWVNGAKEGFESTAAVGGAITFNRTTVGALVRGSASHFFSGEIMEAHIFPWAFADVDMRNTCWRHQTFFRYVYAPRRLWFPEASGAAATALPWHYYAQQRAQMGH